MSSVVKKRHVLYFTGFDPKGPAHYHRLYSQEAQLQASLKGYAITVGPRLNHSPLATSWAVQFQANPKDDSITTHTTYDFVRWDDVVRSHWTKHPWQIALHTLQTSWAYVYQGVAWHFLKYTWPAFLALFMPAALLVVCLVLALSSIALALVWALAGANPLLAGLSSLLFIAILLGVLHTLDTRFHMSWLMRSFHFTRESMVGRAPDLQTRLDALANYLAQLVMDSNADEILLVGHSTGGGMAVSALARAWQRHHAQIPLMRWQRVSLLTVGQWFPLLSLMREAKPMREELATVALHFNTQWVDISAPADGCCTALVDPLDAVRAIEAIECPSPKLLSPRFQTLFSNQAYRALKRDRFRLHFQYLMASPIAGHYDYFLITAGDKRLAKYFDELSSVIGFTGISFPFVRPKKARAR
jgi:hypothetical protein